MKTDRRGLFRLLAGGLALLSGRPSRARAEDAAPEVHRLSRNTWRGALGPGRARPDEPGGPFKAYPEALRLPLGPATPAPAPTLAGLVRSHSPTLGFRPRPLPLATLARLLHFANGVTGKSGDTRLRAAPSAGALYAVEVYVVAERVSGLPPGVYYYDVLHHALAQLRAGAFIAEAVRALERPGDAANAAAVVVLTNVFRRYTARYRNRGYRYALIDTGHVGENLRTAARSAGLGETAPLRFHDDAFHALLAVDGREEAVCAVHALGEPAAAAAPEAPRPFAERQSLRSSELRVSGYVTQRYHEATKLIPVDEAPPGAPPRPATPVPVRFRVPLPGREGVPSASAEQAIHQRRSAAFFRRQPVALADLGFALEMARGHPVLERAPGVDLYLAAHRVRGLQPGLYRYESADHQLAALRQGDLSGPLTAACGGQEMAGTAAAGLLMVARFARRPGRAGLGDRTYRDQLIESGAIGERIYLAAESAGLAARNLAAFRDDSLNELVGVDGEREAVIHLTMLGYGD